MRIKVVRAGDSAFEAAYQRVLQRMDVVDDVAVPVVRVVQEILGEVRKHGDVAVARYTQAFDRHTLPPSKWRVRREAFKRAYKKADPKVVESLKYAASRITAFHKRQRQDGWTLKKDGIVLMQRVHPIERVGLYVPGGLASYPSSVLMNAIPARVAGVPKLVLCSPTPEGKQNPYILIAADIVGISEVYGIGGAQAIAALSFGTQTIPKVDKIVGPGNQYVATAKRLVYGEVAIDMIAGPSELLIIADAKADPRYVASDLLSQAEHDEMAVVILITPSAQLARAVEVELAAQAATLPRKDIIKASLAKQGVIFIVRNLHQATRMANAIAPEHLSLFVGNPFDLAPKIVNTGSLFLGETTPQGLGDYIAGPNHVLPTGGTARFSSPLSVDDFIRRSSVVSYTGAALTKTGHHLVRIARAEGLMAHANMVTLRVPKTERSGVASVGK